MLSRFLFALCTLLTLIPSVATGQSLSYANVPYAPNGTSIAYQSGQTYAQGALVNASGALCVSLKLTNSAPISDTTAWSCSPAGSGLTQAQQNAINGALQTSGGTMTGTLTLSGDPTSPNQASTKAYVTAHTLNAYHSIVAFGDSITCGWIQSQGQSLGRTNPYAINDPGCTQANGWPYYIQEWSGLPVHDYAIPADQACDIWPRQIGPQGVAPSSTSMQAYEMQIGTNDANAKGTGGYEANFKACQLASLTWLGIPAEYKVLANAVTSNNGWAFGTSNTVGNYMISNNTGDVLSYSITTTGGPIYLWSTQNDSSSQSGVFTYSIDSGSAISVSTTSPVAMSTQNGTTNSVIAQRIVVPVGTHTVQITHASGPVVAVLGVGTPPANSYYGHPVVAVANVPNGEASSSYGPGSNFDVAAKQYSADDLAIVNQLATDGLDVRWVNTYPYLTGANSEFTDNFHTTPLGAQHIASAFAQGLQFSPRVVTTQITGVNNASTAGTPSFGAGILNGALTAVSDANYLAIPSGVFPTSNLPWTIEARLKSGSTSNLQVALGAGTCGNAPCNNLWIGEVSNGDLATSVYGTGGFINGSNNVTLDSGISIGDGNWHKVDIVYNGSGIATYVDGVAGATLSGTYTPLTSSAGFVGRWVNTGYAWQGAIDEVAFFSYAKTPANLTTPYLGNEPSLTTLYHLDGNAVDSSIH